MRKLTLSTLAGAALLVGAAGATAQPLSPAGDPSAWIADGLVVNGQIAANAAELLGTGVGNVSITGVVAEAIEANPDLTLDQLKTLVQAASQAAPGEAAGVLNTVLSRISSGELTNIEPTSFVVGELAAASMTGMRATCSAGQCAQQAQAITTTATSDPIVQNDPNGESVVSAAITGAAASTQQAGIGDGSNIATGNIPGDDTGGLATGSTVGTGSSVFSSGPSTGAAAGGGEAGGSSSSPSS